MAILIDYNDRKYGQISNCYAKIIYISCDKYTIHYSIQIYINKKSADKDTEIPGRLQDLHIGVINSQCPHDLQSNLNIIQQAYEAFKASYSDIQMEDI